MFTPRIRAIAVAGTFAVTGMAGALAAELPENAPNLMSSWVGIACLAIFGIAYLMVMGEELLRLHKSMPVLVAAGLIWVIVGIGFSMHGSSELIETALKAYLLEYGELFLFLLAAITFVNTMDERGVFAGLKGWLIAKNLSLRSLFWATGGLAFVMSPIADNLTTALVLGAVTVTLGKGRPTFVAIGCINIVVAANAGGAFSPFGDITTLMVWQSGRVQFTEFFSLFLPSLASWLVPAVIMTFSIPKGHPEAATESAVVKPGGKTVVVLFLSTIALTVIGHNLWGLPSAVGMMSGLGFLKLFSYIRTRRALLQDHTRMDLTVLSEIDEDRGSAAFDSYKQMERVEWDTLMFFYGVILCVGALNTLGYLALLSTGLYDGLGPSMANSAIGVISAVIDNIPVMFAVLSMGPEMSHAQWLLVTYAAGVGGSLLSIGSAAGVALMGQARKQYTFMSHLKWTWAIALGYAVGIFVHLALNGK